MNNNFDYLTEFPLPFCYFQLPFARIAGQLFRRKWWSVPEPQIRDRSRRIYWTYQSQNAKRKCQIRLLFLIMCMIRCSMKGQGWGGCCQILLPVFKTTAVLPLLLKLYPAGRAFLLAWFAHTQEDCVNQVRSLLGMSQLSLIAMHLVQWA